MDCILTLGKKDLQQHLQCGICDGLLIDAVALPECHHEYCKSCIVTYCLGQIRGPFLCPNEQCHKEIHKTRPLTMLKNDTSMQTLIYKLFPTVYEDEMANRRAFYEKNPDYRSFFDPVNMNRMATCEDLGTLQNFEWLPRDVPSRLSVTLAYCGILVNDGEQPSCELTKKSLTSQSQPSICYHLSSDTSVAEIKHYLAQKLHLSSEEMIILLLTNIILQDTYTVAEIVRYFSCKEPIQLHLDFLLTEPDSFPTVTLRDAAVERFLRRKPLLICPNSNKRRAAEAPAEAPPRSVPVTSSSAERLMSDSEFATPVVPQVKVRRKRMKRVASAPCLDSSRPETPLALRMSPLANLSTAVAAASSSFSASVDDMERDSPSTSTSSSAVSVDLPVIPAAVVKKRRVRKKKEVVEPVDGSPPPSVRVLLQQKIKRRKRKAEEAAAAAKPTPVAEENQPASALSPQVSAEKAGQELVQRCQEMTKSHAERERIWLSQIAQKKTQMPAPPQQLPTPEPSPSPAPIVMPILTDTIPRHITGKDGFFSVYCPVGRPLDCTPDNPIPAGRTDSTAVVVPVDGSLQPPVVKARRRRSIRPGGLGALSKPQLYSPTLYEEVGTDHTYAKDPRLEPVKKVRSPYHASNAVPMTLTTLDAVSSVEKEKSSPRMKGRKLVDIAPREITIAPTTTPSSSPSTSNKQFFVVTSSSLNTLPQMGHARTFTVGANGTVESTPPMSLLAPLAMAQATPMTPSELPPPKPSPQKATKSPSAAVKSGRYARLAPRPKDDAVADNVYLMQHFDAKYGPKSPNGAVNGQAPPGDVHAQLSDDGRAVHIGYPIPGIPA